MHASGGTVGGAGGGEGIQLRTPCAYSPLWLEHVSPSSCGPLLFQSFETLPSKSCHQGVRQEYSDTTNKGNFLLPHHD